MRADDAPLQPQTLGFIDERFNVARHRIIRLVAVNVDEEPARCRDLAQLRHAARAIRHRALAMRNAADHIYPQVERAQKVLLGMRVAVEAILRKGHELQVDIGLDALPHLDQRLHAEQSVVAHVHMGADGEQALGDGQVAIAHRPLDHCLMRQDRLQLTPQPDAFEQRAGLVIARHTQ